MGMHASPLHRLPLTSLAGTSHCLWTCWTTARKIRMRKRKDRWGSVRSVTSALCVTAPFWRCRTFSTPTSTVASCIPSVRVHFLLCSLLKSLQLQGQNSLLWCNVYENVLECNMYYHHHRTTTVLRPFFWDHPGEPVPEENFWTFWCKGRLTEADTLTILLGATPSRLTYAYLHHPPIFFLQARCPSRHPSNSIKALKATSAFGLGRRR